MSKRRSEAPSQYNPNAPRLSRREQLRQERRRRSLTWNVIILGTALVFLALIAVYVIANQRPGPLPGEQIIPDEGSGTVPVGTALTYRHYPPSSGAHYEEAAAWDVYETPLPEGTFVANLAHGGVVILYECETPCPDLVARLHDLRDKAPPDSRFRRVKILAAPYERDLEAPIVALAWGHQLNLQQYDEDLLLRWYRRFVNQGPDNQP